MSQGSTLYIIILYTICLDWDRCIAVWCQRCWGWARAAPSCSSSTSTSRTSSTRSSKITNDDSGEWLRAIISRRYVTSTDNFVRLSFVYYYNKVNGRLSGFNMLCIWKLTLQWFPIVRWYWLNFFVHNYIDIFLGWRQLLAPFINRVNRYRGLTKGDSWSLVKIAIFERYALYRPKNRHLAPSF